MHHGPAIQRRSYRVGSFQTEPPHKQPKFKRSINRQSRMEKKNHRTLKNDAAHFVIASARGYEMVGALWTMFAPALHQQISSP